MPRRRREHPGRRGLFALPSFCASTFAFTQLHEIVLRFGLIPAQASRLGGLTFLTSFFLHAGVLHLVGNIYFLFVFGDDVENFLRPFRYLALIAMAAFIGDLAHIAADPHSQIPSVGASGGIAGVITFLRAQVSARETRISPALLVAVPVDSVARMVCLCLVDLISSRRRLGAGRRN
ncbi:MAG TPA: hypothetical protein DIT76_09095 [Spartobacteria bacterium]|jgi:membrane associated rhomboid family serine protease|nr:hypothetical protein [Spartobacteria bacterium]